MVDLIDVPCLVNGAWVSSSVVATVADFEGVPRVRLHGASEACVRMAKRSMLQVRKELADTPLSVLVNIVQRAASYYFTDAKDNEIVARLSGSPITYMYRSAETIRTWMAGMPDYLANAFGDVNFERVPVRSGSALVGYRKFLPTGPTVAVMPQNDDGVSAYVLAQLFLSKNPVLVKPSSRGGSAFSTMRFIQALHAAIQLEAPQRPYLLKAIQLVNVLETDDRAVRVANLGVDGANFVLFGSDSSLNELESAINASLKPRSIIRLGTGFSAAIIFADADLHQAVSSILESVMEDRGNKCTTTHALYVHTAVYDAVVALLQQNAQVEQGIHPLDTRARTGVLDVETRAAVQKRVGELYPQCRQGSGVCCVQLEQHDHIEEMPGLWLFIKRIESSEHACALLAADRQRNNMEHNLCTSVYTADSEVVDAIANRIGTHIVKWNMGTNHINFFIEHQGMFIMREVMRQTVVQHMPLVREMEALS